MDAPELSIILPAYNEAKNIPLIVGKIADAMGDIPYEIIVVDDDSPDGTARVTRAIGREKPYVRCVHRINRRGLSGACIEGMMAANAPAVAVMDADMQHDETRLPVMLTEIRKGADLVIGSRYVNGGNASTGFQKKTRAKGSELATALANRITGAYTSDPMSGFFMMTRDLADRSARAISRDGFKILFDIVSRHRLHFDHTSQTGVLMHMITGVGEAGRVGVTAIHNSPAEAETLYQRFVSVLDEEAAARLKE